MLTLLVEHPLEEFTLGVSIIVASLDMMAIMTPTAQFV